MLFRSVDVVVYSTLVSSLQMKRSDAPVNRSIDDAEFSGMDTSIDPDRSEPADKVFVATWRVTYLEDEEFPMA